MKKRFFALALALVMVCSLIPASVHGAGMAESITLRVWAADFDFDWLFARLDVFAASNPQWDITWDVGVCAAGDAAFMIESDPEAAADVYFYSNDQLPRLLNLGVLLPLSTDEAATARSNSSQPLMNTVKDLSGNYYGYPTSGNTWFMYYNKSIFSEEDVKSLETMLEKGQVAFDIRNSWHLPAFYFANGCTLFGEEGNDPAAGAQFGGEKATNVTLRLVELLEHPNFVPDGDGYGNAGLKDGTIGAYFSGSWDYAGLYEALGEDLGAAQPPTVRINGQDKQMQAYLGSQAIGVNGHTPHRAAARALAKFLSSKESQLLRWQANGYTVPASPSLALDPSIMPNVAVAAQINTMAYASRVQPTIEAMNACWGPIGMFGADLVDGIITEQNAAEKTHELYLALNGGRVPNPFTDVPAGSFFEEPVLWAVEKGITNGLSATLFGPITTCNRAQVVTFLWRAAGSPAPTAAYNPFVDVAKGSFYEQPVLWAVEKGITNGADATHFNPTGICNRAQVVTFLYRAFGSPAVSTEGLPFTDVPTGAWYQGPIAWAVEKGITNGLSATEFGPNANCNRAQVVTFLYRAYTD